MDITRLGEPDIEIAGLKIWVHGRQFEDAQDYWDGNWLHVTAYCAEGGAAVRAHGPLLHLSELSHFLKACEKLHETLRGKAELPCMEPNLSVELAVSSPRGNIEAKVRITPDHLSQQHTFGFSIDQSYLPGILRGIRSVLGLYPVRNEGD